MIYIGIPTYNGQNHIALTKALIMELGHNDCSVRMEGSSFLTELFNVFWCDALNSGADYFLMIHADLYPTTEHWIPVMMEELHRAQADALSVVMPIKDNAGLTSTAITTHTNANSRRLTMHEVMRLPETFGVSDVQRALSIPDDVLLINTGLFLVDLKKHRAEMEQMVFRVRNEIQKDGDGKFVSWAWSEDWYWSRDAHKLGLLLAATKTVKAIHSGGRDYCNCCEWGTTEHDVTVPWINGVPGASTDMPHLQATDS